MSERGTKDGDAAASDIDYDEAVKRCEMEKVIIAKEVQRLKEEMVEYKSDANSELRWKESLTVFDTAEKDVLTNLDHSSDLKVMKADVEKEITALAQKAQTLKRQILNGEESSTSGERKTRQLNEAYTEKQAVIQKIDAALGSNHNQRGLIFEALKGVVKILISKLYNEKIKYCDLKFNMCSFLQEYHKLKKKYKETEKLLKNLTDSLHDKQAQESSRTLKELLNDIDSLAQKKLSSFGIRQHVGGENLQTPTPTKTFAHIESKGSYSPQLSHHPLVPRSINATTPTKARPEEGGKTKEASSVYKDRSLDISRNSHLSMKSNISKRYEAVEDDDDSGEDSVEQIGEARSTNKYLERSQHQFKSVSTPDKSLTRVRGISPIGTQKEGNSCFLSPDR